MSLHLRSPATIGTTSRSITIDRHFQNPVKLARISLRPEEQSSCSNHPQERNSNQYDQRRNQQPLLFRCKGPREARETHRTKAAPRSESKGAKILEMIGRTKGATLAEIMTATDWQAHSVSGLLSTAGKIHAMIESSKNDAGERTYSAKS